MDIRCQQFTSEEIANEMLDYFGFQNGLLIGLRDKIFYGESAVSVILLQSVRMLPPRRKWGLIQVPGKVEKKLSGKGDHRSNKPCHFAEQVVK